MSTWATRVTNVLIALNAVGFNSSEAGATAGASSASGCELRTARRQLKACFVR